MALGLMFVLLVKEIDLSVAAINGVCSVLMAKMIVDYGVYSWISAPIAIALGAGIAAMSARWVTFVGVPSFVVTLGLGLGLNGLQLILLPTTARYGLMGTGIDKIALTNISGPLSWGVLAIGLAAYALLVWSSMGAGVGPASSRISRRTWCCRLARPARLVSSSSQYSTLTKAFPSLC